MEVLIATALSSHEVSADAAAERVVWLGAGRLSFELLLPIDAVHFSGAPESARPGVGGLETVGWVLMGLLVCGGVTMIWGLRSAACCRSGRWAYAHLMLQHAPVADEDDLPRMSSVGECASARSLGIDEPSEPGEAHPCARMGRREGALGWEEVRLVGRSLSPRAGLLGPAASGRGPSGVRGGGSCRVTTY